MFLTIRGEIRLENANMSEYDLLITKAASLCAVRSHGRATGIDQTLWRIVAYSGGYFRLAKSLHSR